jgi:hypothetical protein
MNRTLGVENYTLKQIKKCYHGDAKFADDLQCFRP